MTDEAPLRAKLDSSRREFLQGRAAARALVDRASRWADSIAELMPPEAVPGSTPHLRAMRQAMACQFAIQYHAADRDSTDEVVAALDEIERLESQMTIYRDQSEVIDINRRAAEEPVEVEPRLFELLLTAARICDETDGAFDITSTPLSRVWGFLHRKGCIPSDEQIADALEHVGFDQIVLDDERRTIRFLRPGVEINLNSIGKGYALDRAAEQLDTIGMADYLWHGGRSSVLARGHNRSDRHGAWTVGLRHPLHPEHRIAEFHLRNCALSTAGGATQSFSHQGRRYSHVLDPRTGWPAEGVLTATVMAPTASEADALATALMVLGPKESRQVCDANPSIRALLVASSTTCSERIEIHAMGLGPDDWSCLLPANEAHRG